MAWIMDLRKKNLLVSLSGTVNPTRHSHNLSMSEFFPNIPTIKYEGPLSDNPFAFHHYNPEEIVAG